MRRRAFAVALGLLPIMARSPAAQDDDWPRRPVRIVCPFTAGGSQDNIARRLGARLGEYLGHSFVIDNRSGAGGAIAADNVDVVDSMRQGGFEAGFLPLSEVDAFIKGEHKRWGEVIRVAGIKPQ